MHMSGRGVGDAFSDYGDAAGVAGLEHGGGGQVIGRGVGLGLLGVFDKHAAAGRC